jgi:hypothetical protein
MFDFLMNCVGTFGKCFVGMFIVIGGIGIADSLVIQPISKVLYQKELKPGGRKIVK